MRHDASISGVFEGTPGAVPKRSSQGFFNFDQQMPLVKTEDQVRTEQILAQDMREQQARLPKPGSDRVDLDMRAKMKAQRIANEAELRGDVKRNRPQKR